MNIIIKISWYLFLPLWIVWLMVFSLLIAVLMPVICWMDHKDQGYYYKELGWPEGIHHSYMERFKHYYHELYEITVKGINEVISSGP